MRLASALLWALVFAGCAGAPTPSESAATGTSSDPSVDFLLRSAAADFHAHPPRPVAFRGVRSGYSIASDGARQYRLCGEFRTAQGGDDAAWTPFATIRTSNYEQWTGGQAVRFCEGPEVAWDSGDLSAALQGRLDALR